MTRKQNFRTCSILKDKNIYITTHKSNVGDSSVQYFVEFNYSWNNYNMNHIIFLKKINSLVKRFHWFNSNMDYLKQDRLNITDFYEKN